MKNYGLIIKPLTELLKKDKKFEIGVQEKSAIEVVKRILTSQPVLRLFCPTAPTELHTDACKDGFGAILFQQFEGRLHLVYYWRN